MSQPVVYELVQTLAGQARVAARLRAAMPALPPRARLLDVGSSAGAFVRRLGIDAVGVDMDVRALATAHRRNRQNRLVGGDAACLPFPERTFEVTLCVAVSHHLDDAAFRAAIGELARVTAGHLVFLDATLQHRRPISRLLWRYDRGSRPRSASELLAAIREHFETARVEEFSVYHRYLLCIATPHSIPGSPSGAMNSFAL